MACFDGKPCPGCDTEHLGGAYALMFNAMNRWPGIDMMSKLYDLLICHPNVPEVTDNMAPEVQAMVRAWGRLITGMNGVVADGMTIRWVPGTLELLRKIMDEEVRPALVAYEPLKDAHFSDKRHYSGQMNVLRKSAGSAHTLWGARDSTAYEYFVVQWEGDHHDPPHLEHERCGKSFKVHEHFLENLRADPTFYGAFYCPYCKEGDRPWSEMKILPAARVG